MTWGEWLLVWGASGVVGLTGGWLAGMVVAPYRRARAVVDTGPDTDKSINGPQDRNG